MGYWNAGADGSSLHWEHTGLIWGDGPADQVDDGISRFIDSFLASDGRPPTYEEWCAARDAVLEDVRRLTSGAPVAPVAERLRGTAEIAAALDAAAEVFVKETGNAATDEELRSGLLFAASNAAAWESWVDERVRAWTPPSPSTGGESSDYRTASGRVLDDAEIEALADDAENGYDVTNLAERQRG